MKTVLYIGDTDNGRIFDDIARKYKTGLRTISGNNLTAEDVVNLALDTSSNYYAVIINLLEIPSAVARLEFITEEILGEDTVRLCLMCPGCSRDDEKIELALNIGVQFFMIYPSERDNINTFKKLISSEYQSNIHDIFATDETLPQPKEEPNNAKEKTELPDDFKITAKTIAVGSCTPRMGATTISIHLLKTLNTSGFKVCYVDSTMNSEYMQAFFRQNFSKKDFDKEHHMLKFNGIDFYAKVDGNINVHILSQDYDYILYDFGCIRDNPKKANAFLCLDYKLLIGGAECNELQHLFEAYSKLSNTDIALILNFIKKAAENSITELIKKEINTIPFYYPFISKYRTHKKTDKWTSEYFNITKKGENTDEQNNK